MQKNLLIAKYAQTEEDKILFARVLDKQHATEQKNIPAATCFLTDREAELCRRILRENGGSDGLFFGGPADAERVVCLFLPDYLDASWLESEEGPLAVVRATFRPEDRLTHRDFLGSLMGAGIKRETVGDIYVSTGQCDFLVLRDILPYVLQNVTTAGKTALSLREIPFSEICVPPPRIREQHESVASLRLDCILSAGYHISRSDAAEWIRKGTVSLNHLPCEKADRVLSEADVLSVRGKGKLILTKVDGTTRKGRYAVTLAQYQ